MADTTTTEGRVRSLLLEGELGRRLVHVAGTAFPALYLHPSVEWHHVGVVMLGATALALALEGVRLTVGVDWGIYEHLTREYEENAPAAYLLYMVSATAVALAFEPRIAIPAILMLTIADPLAGLVSSNELRPVKRPRALGVMFVICALLALPFAYERPLAVALGAAGGMLADGIKPTVRGILVDDDLTIAPAGAVGLWLGWTLTGLL